MEKGEFNSIGIDGRLDFDRIKKMMLIGLFAAFLVFIGDWILGYGVNNSGTDGLQELFEVSAGKSDLIYLVSALLGLFGITIEGLSYFSIYRLMAGKAPAYAHNLRTGIIGYIAFGACGVYVPCCAVMWLYNKLKPVSESLAFESCMKFCMYFLLPASILFGICLFIMEITQIKAFLKGLTPYPKWCWIFNLGVGMILTFILSKPFEKFAWGNALSFAWISIGNIWQYGGLLLMMKKAKNNKVFIDSIN